jgi:YVTN family beta-propeller protein
MSGPLLAISRTESNEITIFDLGEIEVEVATVRVSGKQPFGLAFDKLSRYLYIACWTSANIAAVSLTSFNEEKSLSAARLPAWATLRPGTNEIWVSNEGAGVVTIINTDLGCVSCQIATGGGPSDIIFTDNGRYAWVTNERDETVSMLNAEARCKEKDIRVGKVPQGMALIQGGTHLLIANFGSNNVSVIDTAARQEVAQIAVGRGPVDVVTVESEDSQYGFVSCFREGAVSVVGVTRQQEIERIATGGKPQGLETGPDGKRVYAAVRGLNELIVLSSAAPHTILRRINLRGGPARMAITPQTGVHRDTPSR